MIKTGQEQVRAKIKACQEGIKATERDSEENMEAAINSMQPELGVANNWVENVLAYVDQLTQYPTTNSVLR
jgi:hypothetical protein